MKKYYYLYQIINLINGKIYIGAHSTDNLDDGYFGSGSLLKKAIRKYGQENFVKITLYEVGCSDDLYKKEAEIVTLDFVERSDTYNLKVGGYGGTTPSIEVRNLLSQKAVKRAAEGTFQKNPNKRSSSIKIPLKVELIGVAPPKLRLKILKPSKKE